MFEDDDVDNDDKTILLYDFWNDEYPSTEDSTTTEESESTPTFYFKDEFLEPYSRMDLGYWVAQQRYNYKYHNGTRMTQQRIQLLNALNFTWDSQEAKWESKYLELKDFYHKYGHCAVRQNTTLGHFVYKQRYYKKLMDRGDLDPAGITSTSSSSLDESHGPAATAAAAADGPEVPPWEDSVIRAPRGGKIYRGKRISPLTPLRIQRLNDICFIWDHWDALWEERYQDLIEFQNIYHSTRVPPSRFPSLGKWVRKLRAELRRLNPGPHQQPLDSNTGSTFLTRDRIDKLNAIGFEWVVRKYSWEDHYQHLLDYKRKFGTVDVPRSYEAPDEHPKLGSWYASQRLAIKKYLNGSLGKSSKQMNAHRLQLLQDAGFKI
jgi:hypothetical protein